MQRLNTSSLYALDGASRHCIEDRKWAMNASRTPPMRGVIKPFLAGWTRGRGRAANTRRDTKVLSRAQTHNSGAGIGLSLSGALAYLNSTAGRKRSKADRRGGKRVVRTRPSRSCGASPLQNVTNAVFTRRQISSYSSLHTAAILFCAPADLREKVVECKAFAFLISR